MILKNFIVFEGIDGAGTTTQLNIIKNRADAENFLFTAEPTASETGRFLRRMLKGEIPITNETAAYSFAADRNEHINGALVTDGKNLVTGVKKAVENNKIVISDRYLFSSLAYQSTGCDPQIPRSLNQFFPLPELLFYFDIEPEVSLQRVDSRGEREIYENVDFLKNTVAEYKKAIAEYDGTPKGEGMKVVYIDATKSKEEISETIWNEISKIL